MTRVLLLFVLLSSRGSTQNTGSGQAWDRLFRLAWIAQDNMEFSMARELAAEGWSLVSAAGPSAFGYADGVEQAYATAVDGFLPASRFYSEALQATASAEFVQVRLQILIHKAFRYSHQQEVEANSAYEEALAIILSMPTPPGYFAQMLRDFADLKGRMGDRAGAERLLARAASAPSYAPIPYPRFGMQDVPTKPFPGYNPGVKKLVEEVVQLLHEGQYERAGVAVEQMYAAIEALPKRERYWEDDHFESIARAYSTAGHKSEAAAVLEREIAASSQLWGTDHLSFAQTLERVAWEYIKELRMLGPAHELIERAVRIIFASAGESSDSMSFVKRTQLRLAEIEGDMETAAVLERQIREIWVAVHGANMKPIAVQ